MINISDQWKHIMLTLPDNYFFELMKNYLGRIETPFNKHKLVDQLARFLVKKNADESILGNLDEKEILLLTSVEFIKTPTAKTIFEFFLGEIPFIEMCDILKTLEEKLIIYSDNGNIFLSPLFEETVRASVINPGLLYKSEEITPDDGSFIWLTDSLLLSFLSFLIHQKDLLKSSGAFKKRAFNQIEELYPNLFLGEEGAKKLDLVRRILHNLKLVRIDGSSLIPREEIWKELIELPRDQAWLYMVAASTTESAHNIGERVSTIKRIIETIPKNRSFYPENLKKLIKALSSDSYLSNNTAISELIDDLILLNILTQREDGTITQNANLDITNINPDYGDSKTVILQPNFDITYKPWITLKDGYLIALFCNLKKMDIYTELLINKESVTRGLTLETLDNLKATLERVTQAPISDNILLTLDEWEQQSKKARHYEASVLILDDDKEYILKETGVLNDLILLNPAKGVYLIKQEDYKHAKELLADVDIVPIDKNHSVPQVHESLPEYNSTLPLLIDWEAKQLTDVKNNVKELKDYVKNLSGTKEEKEDLNKRITRGIIFTKDQIQTGISKTDFSEAKGINYQAKLRLIEVSLKTANDRLEINFVEDFTITKELILPQRIEKDGDKKILHGQKLPQEVDFSIDIGKISLVKRIQTTLF